MTGPPPVPRLRFAAFGIALLAGALLAAGCTTDAPEAAGEIGSASPTPAGEVTAGGVTADEVTAGGAADGPEQGRDADESAAGDGRPPTEVEPAMWEGCGGGFECATVTVPVDHDEPGGPSLDLALVRRPAGRGDDAVGSILVNPGGPGGSGVATIRGGLTLDAETMDAYHLVGFDPRGVGGSSPLDCARPDDGEPQPDLDPDDAAERADLDAWARSLAERCQARHGDLLPHLSTDSVVDDLDLLRRAVGDERLTYLGFSYGTFIGLRYAERYPDRVGRMILDGVVDPARTLTGLLAQQAVGFDRVLATADEACGRRFSCPDGGLAASYDRLAARLDDEGPIGDTGSAELAIGTLLSLYAEALWPRLATALIEAEQGDAGGIEALYRIYAGAADQAVYNAVVCTDGPVPVGAEAWDRLADDLAERSPRFGAVLANEVRACAHWPVRATEAPTGVAPEGLAPVLVLTTTGDAATPAENAVTVAAALDGAGLVTVDDTSHTALGRNACVQQIVADYLATGRVPETVHRC